MSTSITAHDILDLLDDPAQIAATSGPVWITTDRHTRAQAAQYARVLAIYEQQVNDLLQLVHLPRSSLVYRGKHLLGLTAPAAVARTGAPPGWFLSGKNLLKPTVRSGPIGREAAQSFRAAEYRPDAAEFVDGLRSPAVGTLLSGAGAVAFAGSAAADENAVAGTQWERIPDQLWTQVRNFAEEDLADLGVPRPGTHP
ncbi:hypothetical protein [Gordonia sihwensis]|uniref:hypothetical protein n=1 Tax=Gordonia sihwensis TaxID=173559 RepID=UPI0005EF9106|nr:hypothetical protein [Gordonia sihwensis]KJR10484.1 hypothetical protein UG54_00330 [Gordonia sihwensis]